MITFNPIISSVQPNQNNNIKFGSVINVEFYSKADNKLLNLERDESKLILSTLADIISGRLSPKNKNKILKSFSSIEDLKPLEDIEYFSNKGKYSILTGKDANKISFINELKRLIDVEIENFFFVRPKNIEKTECNESTDLSATMTYLKVVIKRTINTATENMLNKSRNVKSAKVFIDKKNTAKNSNYKIVDVELT